MLSGDETHIHRYSKNFTNFERESFIQEKEKKDLSGQSGKGHKRVKSDAVETRQKMAFV